MTEIRTRHAIVVNQEAEKDFSKIYEEAYEESEVV